jgi:hypothetical protein
MAKYDGLIIPRSYNDYINKSDPAGVAQALQLTGVMDNAPTAQSTKPAKSGGIFAANAVIMASSATLTGVAISAGSVVRVLFTADLTGSDATTGLTITYNGNTYAVKAGKDGALVALTAHLIEESYVYLQAYTTLELAFDGSQFVVMGNPVVISNADFSIMADGSKLQRGSHRENVTGNVTSKLIATLQPNETIIVNAFAYPNNSTPTSLQIAVSSEWGIAYSKDSPFCSATLVYTNKEGYPVNITYSATWDNSNINRTGYDYIIITK